MKIGFFELQEWEKELLQQTFPDAKLIGEKLTPENVSSYTDLEVISSFIYSSLQKDVLEKLPNLKLIATRSTGYDHIDVNFAKEKGITVANVPEYGSRTVAEFTFALILSLTRKIYQSVNQGKQCIFEHQAIRGIDLFGKTLGIIGLGKIGIEVVKIAHGFGMKVFVNTRTRKDELAQELNFEYKELDELLRESDVVSLHLPYNEETRHKINKTNILNMKPGSYLVNTARGPLIETEAIIVALEKKILEGIALDVLEEEKNLTDEVEVLSSFFKEQVDYKTLCMDHALINHPKVIITPHNAFNSKEALLRITETTIENIQNFLKGSTINTI